MNTDIVVEINRLWEPVYPYMAGHLLDVSGVRAGIVLDLGPFAGGIAVALLQRASDLRAVVRDERMPVLEWTLEFAGRAGVSDRLEARQAPLDPLDEPDRAYDLVVVRGAFFFLTPALLAAVGRVLRPGGFAWVGGGYGPRTPPEVIGPIADRSRDLNARLGKRWIHADQARLIVDEAGLGDRARVVEQGGLWIEVRA